ncbi:MAG: TRAP transporter small permease subunit [Deltaproteobacteria bacterium]|nr:TRAP transporter small permease subunit [Deltaproteobacteria bacterium]
MKRFFHSIYGAIQSAEMNFSIIAMSITTLLICATVVNRYVLHIEIMWLNDLALYIFVFFMFTAFAVTAYKEGHISIDIFRTHVFKNRPAGGAFYRLFLVALSILILCIFLPVAYHFMVRAIRYPEYGTLLRWFNTSWLQIFLFIALLLVLVHLLVILIRDIRELVKAINNRPGVGRE